MPLKKEPSGRRSVQVEIEVPGTPEEVWQAIATGPGVSSWFVPTEVREDGAVVANFGPGMESVARVTAWNPPHMFAAESEDLGPNAPKVATEWIVEARSGGACIVRVVHSLFASSDDWDGQLEGWESGWPWFFQVLRLYLTHFRGQPSAAFRLIGAAPEPAVAAWEKLAGLLGVAGAAVGGRVAGPAGLPPLAGSVERLAAGQAIMLRLDAPTSGILSAFAHAMGGQVVLAADFYLYGAEATAVVGRDEPRWQAWMKENFPLGDQAPAAC
jgi:uncharacterized protein YndB with AHSA1/START domain